MSEQISIDDLAKALQRGSDKPLYLGKLEKTVFAEVNRLREILNEPMLESDNVWIYPNVIKKLGWKRLKIDGLKARKYASMVLRVMTSKQARVLPTRYKHVQSCDLMKPDGRKTEVIYVGKKDDKVSLKSAYLKDAYDVNKFASGGAAQPPMKSASADNAPTSIIPGTRSKC